MDDQFQWEVGSALWSECSGFDGNGGVSQPAESESALHGAPRAGGSFEASHNLLLRSGVGRGIEHGQPLHYTRRFAEWFLKIARKMYPSFRGSAFAIRSAHHTTRIPRYTTRWLANSLHYK